MFCTVNKVSQSRSLANLKTETCGYIPIELVSYETKEIYMQKCIPDNTFHFCRICGNFIYCAEQDCPSSFEIIYLFEIKGSYSLIDEPFFYEGKKFLLTTVNYSGENTICSGYINDN